MDEQDLRLTHRPFAVGILWNVVKRQRCEFGICCVNAITAQSGGHELEGRRKNSMSLWVKVLPDCRNVSKLYSPSAIPLFLEPGSHSLQ